MPEIYVVNVDVDYEGTKESYLFLSREAADLKFDELEKQASEFNEMVYMYDVVPNTNYLWSPPVRRSRTNAEKCG